MKKYVLLSTALVCLVALPLALGAQQRGYGSPVKALGLGPGALGIQQKDAVVQYPSSSTLGYRGVVAADVNTTNDATNKNELVVDFGTIGLWVMEGFSAAYDNTWNMITSVNPDWIISAHLATAGGDAILGDFGTLGLWKWTYNTGYPGSWVQLSGVNPDAGFATDDDGDGLQELQVDFGTLGVWRYDDNNGGTFSWNQYSGLNPTIGVRSAIQPPASDQGVWSFGAVGAWRLNWTTGPQYAQLTGTAVAGNDDASGKFTGGAGEDLVLDFGTLGLWLSGAVGTWNQIVSQQTSFVDKVKFEGSANDQLVVVYKNTPGLNLWSYSNFPGTVTQLDPTSPDADGAIEPFDPDAVTEGTIDDELACDYGAQGLWVYDSGTQGWIQINLDNPIFMVAANFWADPANTTLVVNFGANGLWLYDGAYDYWWPISAYAPDSSYGF